MKMLIIFFSFLVTEVHPLHISVTEIAFDEKEKELEIILRVFTDDLELAIRNQKGNPEINLFNVQRETLDKLAWGYLKEKFEITVDGHKQLVTYLGHETDEDVLLFYIQVQPVKKWKSIEVMNSVITELYEDQSNLVNVIVAGQTKSLRLLRNNPSGKLSFDTK